MNPSVPAILPPFLSRNLIIGDDPERRWLDSAGPTLRHIPFPYAQFEDPELVREAFQDLPESQRIPLWSVNSRKCFGWVLLTSHEIMALFIQSYCGKEASRAKDFT